MEKCLMFKMDPEPKFSCDNMYFDGSFFGESNDCRVIKETSLFEYPYSGVDILVNDNTSEICGFCYQFGPEHYDYLKNIVKMCDERTFNFRMPGCEYLKNRIFISGNEKRKMYHPETGILEINWSNYKKTNNLVYFDFFPVEFVFKVDKNETKIFCGLACEEAEKFFKYLKVTMTNPRNIIFK
jgi:hypothetical protein